jgi:hypothetical protein
MAGISEQPVGRSLTRTEFGIQGSRLFIYDPDDDTEDSEDTTTIIPIGGNFYDNSNEEVGESASAELGEQTAKHVICRSIDQSFWHGDPTKKQYLCQFSNEITDWTYYDDSLDITLENLPTEMEAGGDYQCLNPIPEATTSDWYFASDGANLIKEVIPFKVTTASLKVTRFIKDDEFNNFQNSSIGYLGKINMNDDSTADVVDPTEFDFTTLNTGNNLLSSFPGCWLYNGFTSEPHYALQPNTDISENLTTDDFLQYHKVEMTFLFRCPGDLFDNNTFIQEGWNMILSNNGTWQIPTQGTRKIYAYCGSTTFEDILS